MTPCWQHTSDNDDIMMSRSPVAASYAKDERLRQDVFFFLHAAGAGSKKSSMHAHLCSWGSLKLKLFLVMKGS